MTDLNTTVTWVDARAHRPDDGAPVAAAITGHYPPPDDSGSGESFWLVRPLVYTTHHIAEDGTHHLDCFVDSDGVVRLPYGGGSEETVTHWAALPALPGGTGHVVLGGEVGPALRRVWDARPAT
ncbi:AQJ64_40280 family protein [Streptomyces sp. NPDC046887]|uniref:AQJ64_40280 family protein n=1 Tax=Streptomyces sp. NPDC046887 TaxID=3155472 RepID=UPI00340C4664